MTKSGFITGDVLIGAFLLGEDLGCLWFDNLSGWKVSNVGVVGCWS